MGTSDARIGVIIASVGRPDCLRHTTKALAKQTLSPSQVIYAVTKAEDVHQPIDLPVGPATQVEVLYCGKGLPRQRNAGLEALAAECDFVVFFDDDFYPSRFALEGIVKAFSENDGVNGLTGHVIADGIHTPGIAEAEAVALVEAWDEDRGHRDHRILQDDMIGLYGCNMAYRVSAIGETRFDETLPLYAWQEDIDFGARIPGRKIKTNALAGVHRGTKSSRETAGRRLGYSQIVNPFYLWRKGSLPGWFATRLALRNFLANHAKQIRPEPWIDRRGRLIGNWIGLADILAGRSDPRRILDFEA
ncbi:MAG: glycosyltransferase [Pseudomonadota bacterium]